MIPYIALAFAFIAGVYFHRSLEWLVVTNVDDDERPRIVLHTVSYHNKL